MKKQAVTMKDVATLAGVTQATVSYVLNNTQPVSAEVKTKVLNSIEQLGYIPNIYARGLKTRQSNVIGLLLPDICVDFFAEIARTIERKLQNEGYVLILGNTSYNPISENKYISTFFEFNVAGIIISYGVSDRKIYDRLIKRKTPFITLDESVEFPGEIIPAVEIDNILGANLAVSHLANIGSKRIAFASEPLCNSALKNRFEGYKHALVECGMEFDESICFIENHQHDKFEIGRNLGSRILIDSSIDAVFASNDQIACGIISRFREYNISIPKEIAIIGYDNTSWSSLITPELSTISQPNITMAEIGVSNMLNLIKKHPLAQEDYKVMLKPSIIIRKSTMRVNR
ncbi:MAG: LacI family DNA-binding transcriptional regulator [Eubacteriales bacterium]|nr:LacI family DNA-binding transcriptional regulator [Eubacteriales bacterium]